MVDSAAELDAEPFDPELFEPEPLAREALERSVSGPLLLLNNDRFEVRAEWETTTTSGLGTPVAITGDTGYFWFFNAENVEAVVKVLNGCAINNRYWVFAGGLTDVAVRLTVKDKVHGTDADLRGTRRRRRSSRSRIRPPSPPARELNSGQTFCPQEAREP